MRQKIEKYITGKKAAVFLVFLAAFFAGSAAAELRGRIAGVHEVSGSKTEPQGTGTGLSQAADRAASAPKPEAASDGNWGLSFQEEGKPPVANAGFEELAQYDAWYAENTQEPVIYLTFDCGFENGNTPKILDALKKHGVSATFFSVGNFIQDNPELIRRMVKEGHTVGNHTLHHPDMSKISDMEAFQKEIEGVEELYREATGEEMKKYYRAPQGKYSENNLKMAQQLGYKTFFWSLAYVDWYQDRQPTKEEAFQKLLGRIHPGAIVLLHNTSSTNGEIMDELLAKWKEMGYSFKTLDDLAGNPVSGR